MKILLFGATGMIGSRIAAEALRRGHEVTAVSRHGKVPEGLEGNPALTAVAGDASDPHTVARLAEGQDAVASALAPPRDGTPLTPFVATNQSLVEGVRAAGAGASGHGRLVVTGGAGSLLVNGKPLVEQPGFPDAYKGEALIHKDVLAQYRTVTDVDWTYISPAAEIAPGERTGTFRVGGDELQVGADGGSRISAEDYAIGFVDELEKDAHPRQRINLAY